MSMIMATISSLYMDIVVNIKHASLSLDASHYNIMCRVVQSTYGAFQEAVGKTGEEFREGRTIRLFHYFTYCTCIRYTM